MANRSMPLYTFIPELGYANVTAGAARLCRAFGLQERLRIGDHRCQLVFGAGSMVVVGSRVPEGDRAHSVMVSVPDVDRHHAQALVAGARILRSPETHPFGKRQYTAEDLGGHQWTFSQSVADVDRVS